MVIQLFCLFLSYNLYAADSPINYRTPLKSQYELKHATVMDLDDSTQTVWQEKFDEYCYQATCASGIAATVGMSLGCAAPAMFGLSIGPLKGCCLGMLGSTPVCACITCYYAQAHNAEVNEIEKYNASLEQAIQAREMAEDD